MPNELNETEFFKYLRPFCFRSCLFKYLTWPILKRCLHSTLRFFRFDWKEYQDPIDLFTYLWFHLTRNVLGSLNFALWGFQYTEIRVFYHSDNELSMKIFSDVPFRYVDFSEKLKFAKSCFKYVQGLLSIRLLFWRPEGQKVDFRE